VSESESTTDTLDAALASLPREIAPSRDLWSGIRSQIDANRVTQLPRQSPSSEARPATASTTWSRLAAAVLLIVATALTTYAITRQSMNQSGRQIAIDYTPAAPLQATPASFQGMPTNFGGQAVLGAGYEKARAALDAEFEKRLATLPSVERAKIERNLADLRRAARETSETLAQHPSDPLLHELLLSTYQNELRLLADVNELTAASETRTDL
jgi:hypothetical protein